MSKPQPTRTVPPAKPTPRPVGVEEILVVPGLGEVPVSQLIEKFKEQRAISPGAGRKMDLAKEIIRRLWALNTLTIPTSAFNETQSAIKQDKEIKVGVGVGYLINNGWMKRIKIPGALGFYSITKTGAEFAGIDVSTKPRQVPGAPSPQAVQKAGEAVEFLEEQ